MIALDVAVVVLLFDIAVSLRRRLGAGTPFGVTYTWLYPPDWPHLLRRKR